MPALPNPFDSGVLSALSSDEAAASPSFPGAAADIPEPTSSTGGPQGSPAPGQELCGAGDLDCIGEIFVGARKLEQIPGIFDQAAITPADELLYVTLKAMDDPYAADLIDIPAGMWLEFDPPPLFLQRQA
jgi:hypothetical protein